MLDFNKCMMFPMIRVNDSKKEKLRKYVCHVRGHLEENDLENVNKYLTYIEELYNANN